jgi:hypothetical protein
MWKLKDKPTNDKFHSTSKLGNEWKFQTPHKTWHVVIHSTSIYMAPVSLVSPISQWACDHSHKIHASVGWEIPNCNFILPLTWTLAP